MLSSTPYAALGVGFDLELLSELAGSSAPSIIAGLPILVGILLLTAQQFFPPFKRARNRLLEAQRSSGATAEMRQNV
jgi:hypothetical protein